MSCSKMLSRAACLLVFCTLLALPALGVTWPTIQKGVDVFQTTPAGGTLIDFSYNPIPADFFCAGSPAFTGTVNLKGVPLVTVPSGVAGNADTIVERLADAVFTSSGVAKVPIVVRALGLTSTNNIQVYCPNEGGKTEWRVETCLCGCGTGSLQPITSLDLKVTQDCGCGVANGTLELDVCLRFVNLDTNQTVGPVTQKIVLGIKDMPWCPDAGNGDLVIKAPFAVDTNCDDKADLQLPATSNFHPGRSCDTQSLDCLTLNAAHTTCHENYTNPGAHDHCVNLVCGKR